MHKHNKTPGVPPYSMRGFITRIPGKVEQERGPRILVSNVCLWQISALNLCLLQHDLSLTTSSPVMAQKRKRSDALPDTLEDRSSTSRKLTTACTECRKQKVTYQAFHEKLKLMTGRSNVTWSMRYLPVRGVLEEAWPASYIHPSATMDTIISKRSILPKMLGTFTC